MYPNTVLLLGGVLLVDGRVERVAALALDWHVSCRLLPRLDRAKVVTPARAIVDKVALTEGLLEVLARLGLETGFYLLLLLVMQQGLLLLLRGLLHRLRLLLLLLEWHLAGA